MKRLSFLLFALLVSCGSDPPGTVDEEAIALDVGACARGDTSCTMTGGYATELIEPGVNNAVALPKGASISAKLQRPFDGKLVWLAVGTRSGDHSSMRVQIGDAPPVVVSPAPWLSRVEVDMGRVRPTKGAVVTITSLEDELDIAWVVGRWAY